MADPLISTVILGMVADAFIAALADKVTGELWTKLKGDPAKNAFKQALGAAIHRYGLTGTRLDLAQPLLKENGPLTEPIVAAELTQLIRFDREPNVELIGQRWRAAIPNSAQWRNFTTEASLLLKHLRDELRATEVFRPVFDAKSLDSIAADAAGSVEALAKVEAQMAMIHDLLAAGLGELIRAFSRSSAEIHERIYDFTALIEDKVEGFVGRTFIFETIDQFIRDNTRGYLFVRGDPGIGKSALAAQLVKTRGYLHHFNVRAEGINKSSTFLQNICAQLIAAYDLDYATLPPEATEDASFLKRLLSEVSAQLDDGRCVIVVDALDEVDLTGIPAGVNVLYLPLTLPPGIFIIATARREQLNLRIDIAERADLYIEQDEPGNIADVREYISTQIPRSGLQTYLAKQQIDSQFFIEHLVKQSQGNFIYLRMVLPEIEQGVYQDLAYQALPAGLASYYEDHWQRMRRRSELDWFEHKLPVILALTVVKEPVSLDLISDFSAIKDRRKVRAVLRDFDQFIYQSEVDAQVGRQRRYRWYHASFFEFIAAKEDIAEERVSLVEANRKIADRLWGDLFGDAGEEKAS